MASLYPRGSEWRRWDLHVHAPGTALNDNFGGDWDGYVKAVQFADSSIEVVGVSTSLNWFLEIYIYGLTVSTTATGKILNGWICLHGTHSIES